MPTYKEALTSAMDILAKDQKTLFLGYGIRYGGMANGTLKNVHVDQLIETPCAENLMLGLAIGLALDGFRPVVFIERFDFITNALDAIVNHLDKIQKLSHGEFFPKVIIRAVVGNTTRPLFTGPTHTQDLVNGVAELAPNLSYACLVHQMDIQRAYARARDSADSWLLVEYKDNYDLTI